MYHWIPDILDRNQRGTLGLYMATRLDCGILNIWDWIISLRGCPMHCGIFSRNLASTHYIPMVPHLHQSSELKNVFDIAKCPLRSKITLD